jgi:FtsZ-binding cell division protein ZapB
MAEVNKKIDAIRFELRSEIEPLKSNIDGLTKKLKQVKKSQEFVAKKYDSVFDNSKQSQESIKRSQPTD